MRNLLLAGLIVSNMIAIAQKIETDLEKYTPKPKRFIDKVEVFAGPSLSFNYGNKLVDNYSDLIENKRLMKVGYSYGIGVYHPVKGRLDINARVLFEQKGTKSQLNSYSYASRSIINSEYSYDYLTFYLAPTFLIGKRKNLRSFYFGSYEHFVQAKNLCKKSSELRLEA